MRETAAALLPREKLLAGTTAAELTDQELLATFLKTGTRDCNVLELAGRSPPATASSRFASGWSPPASSSR